jgi:signal transduction histidine kinase
VSEAGGSSARKFHVAAGLALCLGYFGAVFVATRGSLPQALRSTVVAVVPGVLLAALALRLARWVRRAGAARAWHGLLAAGFALLWNASLVAGFALEHHLSNQPGDFKVRVESLGFGVFTGLLVYASVAGIAFALETGARLRLERERSERAEALRARAELAALRAKLNPHFLFNTLHTVMGLLRRDPALAEEALQDLGDVLRYALDVQRGHEHVTLRDELAIVERYLAIERLRLGDRLRVETEVSPAALERRLPAFTLQPVIENAVRYAVAPRATGGRVRLEADVEDDTLRLVVADDGAAPTEENGGAGLGLSLVRQRLEAAFGPRATLEAGRGERGFVVTLRVPS